MAWLGTWGNRIELTIPDTNVDSNLTNFPVLIYLSAASGISDDDVTAVFDELGSDANRKKIAVTTSNGTTQCYVEIERWNDANEKAWLWVKVPSVLASEGATLYLYYDSDQADNTTYVGDTTDSPAQSVWDSNFIGVWHMGQDPTGGSGCIKDSTSNGYHGTPYGTMTSGDLVDGLIGKALDLDGTDDKILTTCPGVLGSTNRTVEVLLDLTDEDSAHTMIRWGSTSPNGALWDVKVYSGGYFAIFNNGGWAWGETSVWGDGWKYLASVSTTSDVDDVLLYINGTADSHGSDSSYAINTVDDQDVCIGAGSTGGVGIDAIICEVRISNIARPAAWIKATYHSNYDDLIEFGTPTYNPEYSKSIEGKYDIYLQETIQGKYDIEQVPLKDLEGKYDILLNKTVESNYDIYLKKLIEGEYDVCVKKALQALYDVVYTYKYPLDRDSLITKVFAENSPITSIFSKYSLIKEITTIFAENSTITKLWRRDSHISGELLDGYYDFVRKILIGKYDITYPQKYFEGQYDICLKKSLQALYEICVGKSLEGQYDIYQQKTLQGLYETCVAKAIEGVYDVYLQKTIEGKSDIYLQKTIQGKHDIYLKKVIEGKHDIYLQRTMQGVYDISAGDLWGDSDAWGDSDDWGYIAA